MNAKVLFKTEAKQFDNVIPLLIPFYNEIYNILIDSIPFYRNMPIKILDIGCGTGTFAKIIKESFPYAKITCLDFSSNMINIAKSKLEKYDDDINFLVSDFNDLDIKNEFDVVVSSFALHHIQQDSEKLKLYEKIYESLKQNGVFLTADIVLGVNKYIKNLYEKKWEEHIIKKIINNGLKGDTLERYQADDNPSELFNHLKWLENSGFNQVETIWKYYNFAVFGGFKFANEGIRRQ